MLVFASPGCLSCRELIPGLNEVRKTRKGEFDFLVVCRGDVESCQGFGRMNRLEAPMVVDTNGQIEKDYNVTLTPFAYLLDHEGNVVIRGIANDWRQLESLLEQEGTLQTTQTWSEVDGDGDGGRDRRVEGGLMDISTKIAESLARRSSRRQFFKFLGAGSLGAGLFLTGTDVSLGAITAASAAAAGRAIRAARLHRPATNIGRAVQALRPGRRLP